MVAIRQTMVAIRQTMETIRRDKKIMAKLSVKTTLFFT
jgi:hypothetical protein